MTPPVKKYHAPSSSENYNIDNINSEDSTDDEGAPKKKIPSWAVGECIHVATPHNFTRQQIVWLSLGDTLDSCVTCLKHILI